MTLAEPVNIAAGQPEAVHALCDMLLEIAGRDTNRTPSVRRHVSILDHALRYMAPAQRSEAIARIGRLQTKWGPLLPEQEKEIERLEISPETVVVNWLSQRRYPKRILWIIHLSAKAVIKGETSLSLVLDRGYQLEDDGVVSWVSFDSFKEWVLQLRIVRQETTGIYRPGILCRWWAEEMEPTKDPRSAFMACLKQLEQKREDGKRASVKALALASRFQGSI